MNDAKTYHRRKKRLRLASILLQLLFLSCFVCSRGEPLFGFVRSVFAGDLAQRAVFLAVFFASWQAVLWPVRYLSGWKLEKEFGLLKQGFSGWLADYWKSQALGAAFFIASGLLFYAVAGTWPLTAWWLLAFLSFAFSAFFATLFPVWILPLFHKTVPMENNPLRRKLEKTLEHCGFPGLPLFVIRLGEKTTRENAMLAGMGRTRRALLSDTLLSNYSDAEVEMVLAHEAGHHARAHLARSLALEAILAFGAFFILFRLFGAPELLDLRFFPALALLSYLSGLAALPLGNTVSRAHEKEADRFALERYPDLATFRSLMEKLAARNLADPEPGKLEEFLLYTHPSKRNRVRHAEEFLRASLANSARAV